MRELSIPLCDYHTAVTKAMQSGSLYAPDGVHPTERGHYLMAKTFLASQGLTIDEEAPPSPLISTNGTMRYKAFAE